MDTVKAETAEFESVKDLKAMLSSPGPCISVYLGAKGNALEWKECLRTLDPKMEQNGTEARELLATISDWEQVAPAGEPHGKSIAVFRSPETFRVTWVDEQVKSRAVVGPHFYIRPLLAELTRDKTFYILALSQKNVRLLRCTSRSSEEIALPGASSSEHEDPEDKDEYLPKFYKQIDHGVNETLRGKTEPVVLAGVEYELALYQKINSYPHLASECVQGAPNSLKAGEMHARALDAILRCYEKKVDEALAEYNHRVGGGATNRLKEVITAAHDGRVLILLVSDSLESTGSFDEATHRVKGRETGTPDDEDLINDAAVQTILHAGQVLVAPNGKMPNGAPLAAIFRY